MMLHPGYAIRCLLVQLSLAGSAIGWAHGTNAAELQIDRDNIAIDASATVRPGRYYVEDGEGNGVLLIRGSNLTLDFQGATLTGSADGTPADQFQGRGIVIEDSDNVTIKNLTLRGFKVGVYAHRCRNLTIEHCDFSDNYKQQLLSTPQAENGADWLFGHENDENEWLRYGAAVYLDGCREFTLRNNVAHRGQNGICLVRSSEGAVYDNDCSFNSGWGVALYRSCRNTISRNKFDWCIRGYSHGIYNRGQDSAGILVFEQCSDNAFLFNSATHGGDGFFLFAGLETLDETGKGGCNRNLVYRNDFSHASNNGIEATFSTGNRFIENILDEADHAIWAGYSYGSAFIGNKISHCNHGISIEHGSNNRIEDNLIEETGIGVNLWANEAAAFRKRPYGNLHHCRSEQYDILKNRFTRNRLDLRLANTSQVALRHNELQGAPVAVEIAGNSRDVTIAENNISGKVRIAEPAEVKFEGNYFTEPPAGATSTQSPLALEYQEPEPLADLAAAPGKQNAYLPQGAVRGLKYIFVDEWGPYVGQSAGDLENRRR
jgi:parallel beta-helix repeat protein